MNLTEYFHLLQHSGVKQKTLCPICENEVKPYWEPRYNGYRGTCSICNTNWAES